MTRVRKASAVMILSLLASATLSGCNQDAKTAVDNVHNANTVVNQNDARVNKEQSDIDSITGK